jgi:ATP-dependent DNA helicase RecG
LPKPEIIEIGMLVRFIVHLAESISVKTTGSVTGEVELQLELRPELRLESRLESQLAAKVLILLMKNDSGKAELASGLGYKTVSGELHKQIKRFLEFDYLEMTIPEKSRSSKQKYRLMEIEGFSIGFLSAPRILNFLVPLDAGEQPFLEE